MGATHGDELLLGEWACLGILDVGPSHGFAIAARLKTTGDVGRVWSLSRPLTYRSLAKLERLGLVEPVGEERGTAGGNRTILASTPRGRAELRRWLATPVVHLRDLRGELLLKLVVAQMCAIDVTAMLAAQRRRVEELATVLHEDAVGGDDTDVVATWRDEASQAALRFLDRVIATDPRTRTSRG